MAKKPVALDGLLNPHSAPVETGIPQRGSSIPTRGAKEAIGKRKGEKRLTLALDGDTYRRLRLHAAQTDQTHQAILERALIEHLERMKA